MHQLIERYRLCSLVLKTVFQCKNVSVVKTSQLIGCDVTLLHKQVEQLRKTTKIILQYLL